MGNTVNEIIPLFYKDAHNTKTRICMGCQHGSQEFEEVMFDNLCLHLTSTDKSKGMEAQITVFTLPRLLRLLDPHTTPIWFFDGRDNILGFGEKYIKLRKDENIIQYALYLRALDCFYCPSGSEYLLNIPQYGKKRCDSYDQLDWVRYKTALHFITKGTPKPISCNSVDYTIFNHLVESSIPDSEYQFSAPSLYDCCGIKVYANDVCWCNYNFGIDAHNRKEELCSQS